MTNQCVAVVAQQEKDANGSLHEEQTGLETEKLQASAMEEMERRQQRRFFVGCSWQLLYPLLVALLVSAGFFFSSSSTTGCDFLNLSSSFETGSDGFQMGIFLYQNNKVNNGGSAVLKQMKLQNCEWYPQPIKDSIVQTDPSWNASRIMALVAASSGLVAVILSWMMMVMVMTAATCKNSAGNVANRASSSWNHEWPGCFFLSVVLISFYAEICKFILMWSVSGFCHGSGSTENDSIVESLLQWSDSHHSGSSNGELAGSLDNGYICQLGTSAAFSIVAAFLLLLVSILMGVTIATARKRKDSEDMTTTTMRRTLAKRNLGVHCYEATIAGSAMSMDGSSILQQPKTTVTDSSSNNTNEAAQKMEAQQQQQQQEGAAAFSTPKFAAAACKTADFGNDGIVIPSCGTVQLSPSVQKKTKLYDNYNDVAPSLPMAEGDNTATSTNANAMTEVSQLTQSIISSMLGNHNVFTTQRDKKSSHLKRRNN